MNSFRYANIEAERARHGMTVKDLTEAIGVTRKTYYNWIHKGNIPQEKLVRMAELFQTSIDYLLGRKEA